MHPTSMQAIQSFKDLFLPNIPIDGGKILDVGSRDINGTYRELFGNWLYVGLDMEPGPGVDLVPDDIYKWSELEDSTFDAVISGQTFEHIEHPSRTIAEIERVVKRNGHVCIVAPSAGPRHDYPQDYRRYDITAMREMVTAVNLIVESCEINPAGIWKDCVLVARKVQY